MPCYVALFPSIRIYVTAILILCNVSAFAQSDQVVPSVKPTDDAVAWMHRMTSALRGQNYQGIFTYIRGSIFDTVKIVHVVDGNGHEYERLFNLNGDIREVLRTDDTVVCFHPVADNQAPDALSFEAESGDAHSLENINDHSVQIGPFSAIFSERVATAQDMYRLSVLGEDRIAGRAAMKLGISPGNNDRHGYLVWLDKETGLLLQSLLLDRGRVKEIFQFTSLEIGPSVTAQHLASAIVGETMSHQLSLEVNVRSEKPDWRVAWLPKGFRPVGSQGNRLHFSDGLATFSVFIEQSNASSLPEMTTSVGGTIVITRRMKKSGSQITVVGDVPVTTANRVAQSVEPVLY